MTRTGIYKGFYYAIPAAACALCVLLAVALVKYRASPQITLLAAFGFPLLLLAPGRILGHFWRDLLAGLRLLNRREYAASKLYSERFLIEVRKKPWLKNLIWLGTSSYSRDPEALALNNLGAAEIGLGDFDAARSHLEEAIALDGGNPLPFHNIGILAFYTRTEDAEPWFEKARSLGFRGDWSDAVVRASQASFAIREGRIDPKLRELSAEPSPAGPTDCEVQLLNDDRTPMAFVVWVLKHVFGKSHEQAVEIMLTVHGRGQATCGAFDRALAEAKVNRVMSLARELGYPLTCRVVPDAQGHSALSER